MPCRVKKCQPSVDILSSLAWLVPSNNPLGRPVQQHTIRFQPLKSVHLQSVYFLYCINENRSSHQTNAKKKRAEKASLCGPPQTAMDRAVRSPGNHGVSCISVMSLEAHTQKSAKSNLDKQSSFVLLRRRFFLSFLVQMT